MSNVAFLMTVPPNPVAAFSANFCTVAVFVWPAWLIWRQRRFWSAFFYGWFLMVAGQWFAVEAGRGMPNASDSTTVGLTMFAGWLFILPYCGLIVLLRRCFKRERQAPRTAEVSRSERIEDEFE